MRAPLTPSPKPSKGPTVSKFGRRAAGVYVTIMETMSVTTYSLTLTPTLSPDSDDEGLLVFVKERLGPHDVPKGHVLGCFNSCASKTRFET